MTLTANGQFTFNKQLLQHIDVKPGEQILVKKMDDGSLKIQSNKSAIPISKLKGFLKSNLSFTDDEIKKSIEEGYVSRGMSGLDWIN
jgi:bifunctional DNA-binding transcriptional regulator/antitoxin component of YhaV-PrlF toxin-antitoxin module